MAHLAGTVVYVNAGTQLAQLESLQGILSPALIGSFVLLGVLFNLNAIPVNSGWALVAAWMARRDAVQRGMHWLDRVAGVMFIGFGVRLATSDNPSN